MIGDESTVEKGGVEESNDVVELDEDENMEM